MSNPPYVLAACGDVLRNFIGKPLAESADSIRLHAFGIGRNGLPALFDLLSDGDERMIHYRV